MENKSLATLRLMENYSRRLYINTALNIVINGLAGYLILRHSSKTFGLYKWFIFGTVFSAFIMDFHSCFIYGFFLILPTPISCVTGIAKSLGWFWGGHFSYVLLHINLSCCGFSILYSFVYQYFSLIKNVDSFRHPKTIIFMIAFAIIYPFPPLFLNSIGVDYEAGKEYSLKNFNFFTEEIYKNWACDTNLLDWKMYSYLGVSVVEIVAVYVFGLIIGIKILKTMQKVKDSMSPKTLYSRKQYLRTLAIQATVPLIFIVIPISSMMIILAFEMATIQDASLYIFQLFGLHSSGNAITVIFFMRPYRRVLIRWIKNFIQFCKLRTILVKIARLCVSNLT